MDYDTTDIDTLLEKYNDAKEQISILEKKLEKYKKYAEHIMDNEDKDEISNLKFKICSGGLPVPAQCPNPKQEIDSDYWLPIADY